MTKLCTQTIIHSTAGSVMSCACRCQSVYVERVDRDASTSHPRNDGVSRSVNGTELNAQAKIIAKMGGKVDWREFN
jgi:hypothetical protein